MAAVVPTAQTIVSVGGVHYALTTILQATASDTFTAPGGSVAAVALGPKGSATPTVTNSEGSDQDAEGVSAEGRAVGSITVAGGTIGTEYTIVTRHAGNAAAI